MPGPRFKAAAAERDNLPVHPDGRARSDWHGPQATDRWVREHAAMGYDSIKFLVSNDDVFIEGGSHMTQYSAEELNAAGAAARETGVWLNGHCQSPESVKLAVKAGFRSIYHCTYADTEALDLLEAAKDDVFVSPAPGIIYANVHEGEEFGITRRSPTPWARWRRWRVCRRSTPVRRRGIRALIGGDYGFPNNPTGRNARDLQLFVDLFGYTPAEALVAATQYGGQVMGMGEELGCQGRLPGRRPGRQGRPHRRRDGAAGRGQHPLHRAGRRLPQVAGHRGRVTDPMLPDGVWSAGTSSTPRSRATVR